VVGNPRDRSCPFYDIRHGPPMAAGVIDKRWSIADMVKLIEDWETRRALPPEDRLLG
jgi:hypothetical protein